MRGYRPVGQLSRAGHSRTSGIVTCMTPASSSYSLTHSPQSAVEAGTTFLPRNMRPRCVLVKRPIALDRFLSLTDRPRSRFRVMALDTLLAGSVRAAASLEIAPCRGCSTRCAPVVRWYVLPSSDQFASSPIWRVWKDLKELTLLLDYLISTRQQQRSSNRVPNETLIVRS